MNLDNLAEDLHETATVKGFWDPMIDLQNEGEEFVFYAKQLAMIHSEVTEVLEALRKEKGEQQVVEELADIIIRVLDLYAGLRDISGFRLSLNQVLLDKARYNMSRPAKHGVLG